MEYLNDIHITGRLISKIINNYNNSTTDYDYDFNIKSDRWEFPVRFITKIEFYADFNSMLDIHGVLRTDKGDLFVSASSITII